MYIAFWQLHSHLYLGNPRVIWDSAAFIKKNLNQKQVQLQDNSQLNNLSNVTAEQKNVKAMYGLAHLPAALYNFSRNTVPLHGTAFLATLSL